MFIPSASSTRSRRFLRRIRDPRCCNRNHRQSTGTGNYKDHTRTSRHVPCWLIMNLHSFCSFDSDQSRSLLLFDALGCPPFRSIKLRSKKPTCKACSNPSESLKNMANTDYVQFCGGPAPDLITQGSVVARGSNYRASAKVRYDATARNELLKREAGTTRVDFVREATDDP
jgi:hypothetical protein